MPYEYKIHFGEVNPLCGHAVWSDNMIVTVIREDVTCKSCLRCLEARIS